MKRPISLTIVGTAWFLIALFGAINNAIQGHGLAMPGNDIINLLIGVGLLNGWRICRWYALFVTGFSLVVMLPLTPWLLCNTGELVYHFPLALMRDQRPHEATSLVIIVLFLLTYLVASGWIFYVLRRRDVREFFQRKTNSPTPVSI